MSDCKHQAVHASVEILSLDGSNMPTHADMTIVCAFCRRPFRFKGLTAQGEIAPGPSSIKPMAEEVRLPIELLPVGRA